MSQQAAAGAAGCCCRRDLEPCLCSEMYAPMSLTVSAGLSVSIIGSGSCGETISGGASMQPVTMTRTAYVPGSGIIQYSSDANPPTCADQYGLVSCTNLQCTFPRNCTNPQCDPPLIVQEVTEGRAWFSDNQQVGTAVDQACAGVSYTYGNYCEWSNPTLPGTYQTSVPGSLRFWGRATLSAMGGNPCVVMATVSLFAVSFCPGPKTWVNPITCSLSVGGSYQKVCRFPGDSIAGTYVADAPINEVCSNTVEVAGRTYSYTVTRTGPQSITIA